MKWTSAIGREMALYDFRIIWVAVIASLVIVTDNYFFRSPLNLTGSFLNRFNGDQLSLYSDLAWHLQKLLLLFIGPLTAMSLLNRFSSRKYSPIKYTFTLGDYRVGGKLILLFVAVTVSIHYLLVLAGLNRPDYYPMCKSPLIVRYFSIFLLYEFFQFLHNVGFEYFFRGFLLLELEKVFGKNALALTLLPYIIIKLGKPPLEVYTAIPVGIALAYMTIRTRSFWYAALAHFLLAALVDMLALYCT